MIASERHDLILPRDVLALDILFKFDGLETFWLEFINVLYRNRGPTQLRKGAIAPFASDQLEVARYY
jgi:hypothetical protein